MRHEPDGLALVLAALFTTFGKEVTPSLLMGYSMGLSDAPLPAVEEAVQKAIRSCKFLPSVAEIRELAGLKLARAEDMAGEAWEDVLATIRSCGSYGSPLFHDPSIGPAIARMGGWIALCAKESEWLHSWGRKTFTAEYASVVEFGASPFERNRRLEGRHEVSKRISAGSTTGSVIDDIITDATKAARQIP